MALETLKDVEKIDGFDVIDLDVRRRSLEMQGSDGSFDWDKFDKEREKKPVSICHSQNMISFRIQNGPIKEVGVNGCQVDTLIEAAMLIIEKLNEKFPCRENLSAIYSLKHAILHLKERKKSREIRGVEGKSKL